MKKIILLLVLWVFALPSVEAVTMTTQQTTLPGYQFQSTSAYAPTINSSAYAPTLSAPYATAPKMVGGMRRSFGDPAAENEGFGNPEGQGPGIGELPDPAPIGEPLVLLLMAMLYALGHFIATRKKHSITN